MLFRVELRSISHEFRAIIREAILVDAIDAIDAAQIGRIKTAELYRDELCQWRVEAVVPIPQR